MMYHLFLAGLGGALGAGMRYLVGFATLRIAGVGFPWGTLIVNIVGSLAMGLLIGWLAKRSGTSEGVRIFLATGVLGGFTTFSAFSLDAINLYERGDVGAAFFYVSVSVIAAIAAVFLGLSIMRSVA